MCVALIVHLGLYWELRGTLVLGTIGSGICPFGEYGLDEKFGLAIGARGKWSRPNMVQSEVLVGIPAGKNCVVRALIGYAAGVGNS